MLNKMIHAAIDEDTYKKIRAVALRTGAPVSLVIRWALNRYLAEESNGTRKTGR
jgi:hypothetical protein